MDGFDDIKNDQYLINFEFGVFCSFLGVLYNTPKNTETVQQ